MPLARVALESLLRARRLDQTLTTALPAPDPDPEYACGPSGVPGVAAPRGQVSEIVGGRSSGRSSLLTSLMAAATRRGELVALVDALDMLDVASTAAAGVDLDRLLWIRGHVAVDPGFCRDTNQRALEQAIRALALVLQAGNFGLVAFDAGEAPPEALRRLPFTTWLRLQRMVEGTQTVCVLVGPAPMARSAAGLTVRLGRTGQAGSARGHASPRTSESEGEHHRKYARRVPASADASARSRRSSHETSASGGGGPQRQWKNVDEIRFTNRLFTGLTIEARVICARRQPREDAAVAIQTTASSDA